MHSSAAVTDRICLASSILVCLLGIMYDAAQATPDIFASSKVRTVLCMRLRQIQPHPPAPVSYSQDAITGLVFFVIIGTTVYIAFIIVYELYTVLSEQKASERAKKSGAKLGAAASTRNLAGGGADVEMAVRVALGGRGTLRRKYVSPASAAPLRRCDGREAGPHVDADEPAVHLGRRGWLARWRRQWPCHGHAVTLGNRCDDRRTVRSATARVVACLPGACSISTLWAMWRYVLANAPPASCRAPSPS